MTLKLILDAPQRVYRPGDTITGNVKLSSDIEQVDLVLQSIAKTKTKTKHATSHGRASLLHESHPLPVPATEADKSGGAESSLSFAIELSHKVGQVKDFAPPGTKVQEYGSHWNYENQWKEYPGYQDQADHPLPPTCRFGPRGIVATGTVSLVSTDKAKDLGAAEVLDKVGNHSDRPNAKAVRQLASDIQPFWIQNGPQRLDQKQYSQNRLKRLEFQTMRLSPTFANQQERKLSFGHRFKASYGSSSVPQAAFAVVLHRPRWLEVGSKIALSVNVVPMITALEQRKEMTKLQVPIPDVTLMQMKIQIQAETGVRTINFLRTLEDSWEETVCKDQHGATTELPFLTRWLAEDLAGWLTQSAEPLPAWADATAHDVSHGRADMRHRITSKKALPERLVPTFSTYSIYRRYKWLIRLTFECAGEVQNM